MATTNGVATSFLYDVLTLSEAAAYLKLSESDLRAEAEAGRLVGRAVGGDWRFVRNELVTWARTPVLADVPPTVPTFRETEEEYQAYWANILAFRDEVDRLHKRGKYAEEE